jgi:hypothetical protein
VHLEVAVLSLLRLKLPAVQQLVADASAAATAAAARCCCCYCCCSLLLRCRHLLDVPLAVQAFLLIQLDIMVRLTVGVRDQALQPTAVGSPVLGSPTPSGCPGGCSRPTYPSPSSTHRQFTGGREFFLRGRAEQTSRIVSRWRGGDSLLYMML